jgi:hypothetical protein
MTRLKSRFGYAAEETTARAIPRPVAVVVLVSLALPALLGAAASPPYSLLAAKPTPQVPPLPSEEHLVPLLGAPSLSNRDKGDTDPPLPPPVCSLAQCDPQSCPLGPNRACLLQTFQDIQWHLCVYASQF